MYDVAVVASVIPAREHLLRRSWETWIESAKGLNVALCLYLEGIYDPRLALYNHAYLYSRETPSGSHIAGYNYWLDAIPARVYLFTHPEILFPRRTIRKAVEKAKPDVFVTFKVFWLPEYVTENLEQYPWRTPEKLETYSEIYRLDPKDHGPEYWNTDVRKNLDWHSTTTWAMDYHTVQRMRPFPELGHQGYDDPYFYGLRRRLGIFDYVVRDPILFHQFHPQTWDGNMQQAVDEAKMLLDQFQEAPCTS